MLFIQTLRIVYRAIYYASESGRQGIPLDYDPNYSTGLKQRIPGGLLAGTYTISLQGAAIQLNNAECEFHLDISSAVTRWDPFAVFARVTPGSSYPTFSGTVTVEDDITGATFLTVRLVCFQVDDMQPADAAGNIDSFVLRRDT